MNRSSKDKEKLLSFEKMRDDLIKEGVSHLHGIKKESIDQSVNSIISSLYKIVEDAEEAKNSKNFFDTTCQLSSLFEKLDESTLKLVFSNTNLYVLLLNAVFRNITFQKELIRISDSEKPIFNKETDNLNFESKVFLNSGISLAFLAIAEAISIIKEPSILFLRKNLTDFVKYILRNSSGKNTFANLCFRLENISWNNRYHYTDKFPVVLNDKKLFDTLRIARSICGISFLSLTINASLGNQFSNISERADSERFSLSKALSGVYGVIHKLEESEKAYYEGFSEKITNLLKMFFDVFIRNNERNLLFLFKKISSGFQYQEGKKFSEVVLNKIETSTSLMEDLISFAKKNLKAFKGDLGEERYEWSNKVFIASLRLLSVLSGISKAKDIKWKVSTTVYEFRQWINDVHTILNKHSIEDDWISISDYVNQETEEIEWKSTFFTPLEQQFVNNEAEIGIGKKLFEGIIRTILGMLNTSGGVLVVGLIENPEAIVRKELIQNIIYKNGKAFFDIGSELKKMGKSLDNIRLQIFDNLTRITGHSPEKFNDLIDLQSILLKDGESVATIIKIIVKKGEKFFYNVKKEGNIVIWISLTMRAQGQTVDVDIRDYV